MRKTVKKMPACSSATNNVMDDYAPVQDIGSGSENHSMAGNSMEDVQAAQEYRTNRVSQLLNQMSYTGNDGNKLADFQPLAHPVIQKRTDSTDESDSSIKENFSSPLSPMQLATTPPPPPINRQVPGGSDYSPNIQDLGNNLATKSYSNYRMIYEPPKIVPSANYYPKANSGILDDNKLMEKINYMVHLLEQQQNEKTSNVTEEFVLYTFLGVFIIFIVDSFARAGKYVR